MREGFDIYFYEYRGRYAAVMIEITKTRGFWLTRTTSLFDDIKLDIGVIDESGNYFSPWRNVRRITN